MLDIFATAPRPLMKHFPRYLQYLMSGPDYRLVDLSNKIGMNRSDLSNLVNGNRSCGTKTFPLITEGLLEKDRAQAVVSWLRDQLPKSHGHLVEIREANAMVRDEMPNVKTLEGAMAILYKKAESNEALRIALLNMAKAFGS